jgi:hypothetical protein
MVKSRPDKLILNILYFGNDITHFISEYSLMDYKFLLKNGIKILNVQHPSKLQHFLASAKDPETSKIPIKEYFPYFQIV